MFIPTRKGQRNKTTLDRVKRTVWGEPRHGCECLYIQVTKTLGYKLYPQLVNARHALKYQFKAWVVDGAPKVMSEIMLCNFFGKKYHGYITQHAQPIDDFHLYESRLYDIASIIKMDTFDIVSTNCGLINRKPVIIDFGKVTYGHSTNLDNHVRFAKVVEDISKEGQYEYQF